MKLGLVGCGLVGGSLALALRRAGAVTRVRGYDADAGRLARAVALGICDEAAPSAGEAAREADLVVLAVPVGAMAAVAVEVAAAAAPEAVVTDVGSTKRGVVAACEAALGGRFVGGHPIAGGESSGPDAADAALFEGRKVVLTPTARTAAGALAAVGRAWTTVGAEVVELDAERHDRVLAAVSHLPHAAAYALAGALAGPAGEARGFAGRGFVDTTRVAASPAGLWAEIFVENRDALLPLMDALAARLEALRAAIAGGDVHAVERLLAEARDVRQRILG